MAVRNLLHFNKLTAFRDYMEAKGWISAPTKGDYEVLRLVKPKEKPIIMYRKFDCDHVTFEERHFGIVRQFIFDNRKGETT